MLTEILEKELKLIRNYIAPPAKNSYNWSLFQLDITATNVERIAFFSLVIAICDFIIIVGLYLFHSFYCNIINEKVFN
ncbi:MAG: hypothetical protein ACOCXH_14695, partial [Cyclobacteriaceae bacterium]